MEKSWQGYKRNLDDSVLKNLFPKILESRIETCRINYRTKKHKFPNAVILSDDARAVLLNAELLKIPTPISGSKRRDILIGEEFQLGVYEINELPEEKKSLIEKMLSDNPGTLYMGRTNWRGKIKEKSLEWYEFKCSFGDLV